jgi:tetratricopeptide (TPR) repeat protein
MFRHRFSACSILICTLIVLLSSTALASVNVGDKPALKVTEIDGSTIDLSALKGKIVLVDFWVGRSDLNRRYELILKDLYKTYAEQGVAFIGICCDPKVSDASRYIEELGINWPQFHESADWHGGLGREWGVRRVNWDYLIGPDGTVLWTGIPPMVEEQIRNTLIEHPPQLVSPRILEKAGTDLDKVGKLLEDNDRLAAVQQFGHISSDASKDRAFAARMKRESEKIAHASDQLLAEVDPMIDSSQFSQAAARLTTLIDAFKGLPQEKQARDKLSALLANPQASKAISADKQEDDAASQLAAARKLRDEGKATAAYRKAKAIVQDFGSTESGKAAAGIVQSYESDPAFMKTLQDEAVAAKAKPMLALAESYRAAGKIAQARQKYLDVLDQFPNTSFAQSARSALEDLKN